MALSRKHYEEVAAILKTEYVELRGSEEFTGADAVTQVTFNLADYFAKDNPNFDRVRFLNAANPD